MPLLCPSLLCSSKETNGLLIQKRATLGDPIAKSLHRLDLNAHVCLHRAGLASQVVCNGLAQMYGQHPGPTNLAASVFLAAATSTIVPAAFFATRAWLAEMKLSLFGDQTALHGVGRTVLFVLRSGVLAW